MQLTSAPLRFALLLASLLFAGMTFAGDRMEPPLSNADQAKATKLIKTILKKRGFDTDAIKAITESGDGYEPTLGYHISDKFKTRWFGFDPETGKQYPSDVRGFAEALNPCYSKFSPNKYSRQQNLDYYNEQKVEYARNNNGEQLAGPDPSDETFGHCKYRYDPATGCKLSEERAFMCRYFFHNEGGFGTCDNWGAGPMLAFDPNTQGFAKLQLEAPQSTGEVVVAAAAKDPKPEKKKKKKKKQATALACNWGPLEEQYMPYFKAAKADGFPD